MRIPLYTFLPDVHAGYEFDTVTKTCHYNDGQAMVPHETSSGYHFYLVDSKAEDRSIPVAYQTLVRYSQMRKRTGT